MSPLFAAWLLNSLAIRADSIKSTDIASPSFTIVTRRGGQELQFPARIWGVESFSQETLEAESRWRKASEQAQREKDQREGRRIFRDGPVSLWILVNLGWVITKGPVDFILRGIDRDGTLVVDVTTKPIFGYDWVSTTMVSIGEWRASESDLQRDPQLRRAHESARLNRAGYWRFEAIPLSTLRLTNSKLR